jgi:hypothetical protein
VNLSFAMDQQGLALTSAGAGPFTTSVLIDLGAYPDVRAHQNDIKSLDLEFADFTITAVNANNAATSMDLTLSLRKDVTDPSTDVQIGQLMGFQIQRNGTRRLSGTPQLDAFLLDRLHDGGKFYLLLNGTTNARTDIVADVDLHASMAYDTGWF